MLNNLLTAILGYLDLDRLRVARPGIAVLYMSGYGEQALADDGLVADGSPYLAKPFTQEQLAAKVREVLDERGTPLSAGPA